MAEDKDESLIQHLEALRSMLIHCFVALAVGLVPMFLLAPYCMDGLIAIMIGNNEVSLNYFSPMEVFILQIKIAVVLDLVICFPYIARQLWKFVLPALYDNERRFVRSIVLSSTLLFVLGAAFCIFFSQAGASLLQSVDFLSQLEFRPFIIKSTLLCTSNLRI